ncbi:MAG: galactose-1-phosphate uridylyltransferase [Bryobacteraceae bacterium]
MPGDARRGLWEQRWNPLRQEWVVLAAHRQDRPWSGEVVEHPGEGLPEYVPDCYLCPGNRRVSGAVNPPYTGIFVFDNDHPSLAPEAPADLDRPAGIYRNRPARGVCRVICYSPRHNLSPAQLSQREIENLIGVWREQYRELGARPEINCVLIFENRGEVVGVSNPHPHGQIYATNFIFKVLETELHSCHEHYSAIGRPLFQDILEAEREDGRRILFENQSAIVFVPYFARYPYETFVAPKQTRPSLEEVSDSEAADLAEALRWILIRYDNLWRMPFPYVMPLHQAPTDGGDYRWFHLHIEFLPPLRKPNLLKYLAGAEIGGGNYMLDAAPEATARELRQLPGVHYREAAHHE